MKVNIKLMEKGVFKDAMFGMFEFDFSYIYFLENHTMLHKWVALSNPASEDFSAVSGYIKLSISIYGAGDEPV